MPFGLDLVSYGYTALQDAIGKLYVNHTVHKTSSLLGMHENQTKIIVSFISIFIMNHEIDTLWFLPMYISLSKMLLTVMALCTPDFSFCYQLE